MTTPRTTLTGTIGSERWFHLITDSGGSCGHKANVARKTANLYLYKQATTLQSRLATTPTIERNGNYVQRGGTILPGHYTCRYVEKHATFGECIRLLRHKDAMAIHSPFSPHPIPHGRGNDFFIHGSGPKGSDGCLVPANSHERRRLNQAVKNFAGTVVLNVKNVTYQLPAELDGQLA